MEPNQPSSTVGPSATPPDGDGFRAPRRRRGLRFAGWVLLFLGILLGVGVLTALIVFPDPLSVPENELLRGWLIVLGAMVATGTLLLAVAAPRAGYRWFEGALFIIPVYGQVVFAPRVLWRASRSRAGWSGPEPGPRRPEEWASGADAGPEPEEPGDPERIREEARTLAALLSGRGPITLPEAEPEPVSAPLAEEPLPEPAELVEAVSPPAVVPEEPAPERLEEAEEPEEAEETVVYPRTPAETGEPASHPNRRYLAALAVVLLVLWLVAVPAIGAWQLSSERARSDRLATESAELQTQVAELRTELSLLQSELGLLREELESLREAVRVPNS